MEGASEPGQGQGPACGEAHLRGGREAGTGQWLAGSQQPAEEKEPGKGGTQRTSTLIPGSRRHEGEASQVKTMHLQKKVRTPSWSQSRWRVLDLKQ